MSIINSDYQICLAYSGETYYDDYDLLADAVKSLILTLGIYYCYTDDKKNNKYQ